MFKMLKMYLPIFLVNVENNFQSHCAAFAILSQVDFCWPGKCLYYAQLPPRAGWWCKVKGIRNIGQAAGRDRAAQRVSSAREVSEASRRAAHAKLAPKGQEAGGVVRGTGRPVLGEFSELNVRQAHSHSHTLTRSAKCKWRTTLSKCPCAYATYNDRLCGQRDACIFVHTN